MYVCYTFKNMYTFFKINIDLFIFFSEGQQSSDVHSGTLETAGYV